MTAKATAKTTTQRSIERIVSPPPAHWVGDGFKVHGFFPRGIADGHRMSPFYLLDYNAKTTFEASEKLFGVGPHPHRGFETVTIAYKGKLAHHDSRGGGGVIGEGDVQWMTAGSGILHKEYHEEEFNRAGGEFQVVQLWVNLPAKDKMTEPKYQAITNAEMGRVPLEKGGYVEVIAGEYEGVRGPATTFSPVNLFNLKPAAGASVELSFPAEYTVAVLAIRGSAMLNGSRELATDHFALFANDGEDLSIDAKEDSVLLVMAGEPLNEPIAAYGPFLMNTQEEIVRAFEDLRAGKFGELDD